MEVVNQKEYLKKYLSGGKKDKKKKKRKRNEASDRVKIIDDDIGLTKESLNDAEDLFTTNEDAPQIVGVVDERPMHMRIDDYRQSDLWRPLGAATNDTAENAFKGSMFQKEKEFLLKLIKKESNKDFKSISLNKTQKSKRHKDQVNRWNLGSNLTQRKESVEQEDGGVKDEDKNFFVPDDCSSVVTGHNSDNELDSSPPRRSKRSDAPSDSSPPRRSKKSDAPSDSSPPRRSKRSADKSPPRKYKRYSPPRRADSSPKRKLLPGNDKGKYLIPAKRKTKTLDGKTAGLQNATELVAENEAFRKREDDLFKSMSAEYTGVNAQTVLRDRRTGKIRDLKKEEEDKLEKQRQEEINKEKYSRWGKGLKQVEDYENKLQQDVVEMNKPLARYANDEDLERYLKEQEREGDPMLDYIRKKKRSKDVETGRPIKPQFEGEFMPNRFGIRPGHRWDGVDRSNGYEKKWIDVQNAKQAIQEEVYKWSTEDIMSTASAAAKENPHCLICNARVGVSTRTSLQIFSKEVIHHRSNHHVTINFQNQTCTEKPISLVIAQVLEEKITEDSVHSLLICKKCFKLFDELEELEQRIDEIKDEVVANYRRSINIIKNGDENDDEQQQKDNIVPKTLLDIPSSDEDTQASADKPTFNTMADIEMQLVKIHGGKPENDETNRLQDTPFQTYDTDIMDAGALDHSSDSDYEPPGGDNTEALLQAAAIAEKNLAEVQIKSEPGVEISLPEKPNILKRKEIYNDPKKILLNKKFKEETISPVVARDGSLYTCLLCEGEETVCGEAKAIILHVRQVHDNRLYICDVCGQDFRKRNELSMHLDEHVATEEGDFQCEICNRIFSNLRLFRIHKRMHYPQNKAWKCDMCGKKYSSRNLLDEHINVHTGLRPYICATCGKDFASKYTFKAHEKTHEVRPRPFQCQHCNKSFLSQQNLSQHERTHLGIKEFCCQLCSKQFGSAHNLEVHSLVHTGYKPFICGLCGKAFARKAEIRDHERTHTGERPYQCEYCGATFSQRSNLQSHKRATHYDDKRYKCDMCGKGFKRRRLLDYHIKAAHTGERPYKCQVCEATFVYPEHFKKHQRIHTGEKPFLCEVCGKAFNSRDNRNAHRFVHSDKKPYECLVCGAGFMRKPLLYQHMQAQGHLNDTIVVNQPRLTTDDDQIITVNADGEMEIVENEGVANLETIEVADEDATEDSKLYIAEHMLVEGGEMFEDTKTFVNLDEDQMAETEGIEHIIIDGQQIQFAEEGEGEEIEETEEQVEEGQQVVSGTDDIEEMIVNGNILNGKTQVIETPDGPIHYVHVRIPNDNGEDEEAWLKIVRK
ncbi:hypothetical protein FQR65_LT16089 [Abscondita terminalis]|nr:hypothetical protein FQR65_LT16089 [Abscondita terminalis]